MEDIMKRISILACILGVCFVSATWAQQQTGLRHIGKSGILRHRPVHVTSNSTRTTASQSAAVIKTKFYDLGIYPSGTWAQTMDINDWDVAIGLGDTPEGYDSNLDPPRGYTRPIGIPLFGPGAMHWFNLGTFGGESYQNTFETADTAASAITNTGMIVGLAPRADSYIRAFAWTAKSGLVDLGALESLGDYYSNALGVNRLGTIIAGWSGAIDDFTLPALPVSWTPFVTQDHGKPVISWNIHQLEISGYEQFPYWVAETANDFRQITGFAFDDSGNQLGFVWSPMPGGGWKILPVPVPRKYADYIQTYAGGINEKGEIVGNIWNADYSLGLPVLWQPTDPYRQHYKMTVLGTPPGIPDNSSFPAAINDLGDIVGTSYDADGSPRPAYWSTKSPSSGQLLDFSGYVGVANKVNNLRMVVGGYWSDTCPQGCAAAARLR
jgi:probable HAF family extracellular repeat protein